MKKVIRTYSISEDTSKKINEIKKKYGNSKSWIIDVAIHELWEKKILGISSNHIKMLNEGDDNV